jgi:hypothetical protein
MGRPATNNDEANRRRRERYAARKANTGSTNTEAAQGQETDGGQAGLEGITIIGTKDDQELSTLVPRVEESKPKTSKPKSRKKSSIQLDNETTAAMFTGLITSVSHIVAARAGAHWAISAEEAHTISVPAVAVLDRFDLMKKFGDYGDIIALGLAVGSAFVPRVMHHMEISKKQQESQRIRRENDAHVQSVQNSQPSVKRNTPNAETRESGRDADKTVGTNATYGGDNVGYDVAQVIGAIV